MWEKGESAWFASLENHEPFGMIIFPKSPGLDNVILTISGRTVSHISGLKTEHGWLSREGIHGRLRGAQPPVAPGRGEKLSPPSGTSSEVAQFLHRRANAVDVVLLGPLLELIERRLQFRLHSS